MDSLREIAEDASYEASRYVSLVFYDRDKSTAVRYRHAVDASECLELAFQYLTLLKNELDHRMRVDNDRASF